MNPLAPLIIQSDLEILLEVANPQHHEARDAIAPFTELVKSPEHLHTYRISRLSLWNAASVGLSSSEVFVRLEKYSKFPVPASVITEIREYMGRYGRLKLVREGERLFLDGDEPMLIAEVSRLKEAKPCLLDQISPTRVEVALGHRGNLKMALTKNDFPVEDLAGYRVGAPLLVKLRQARQGDGKPFALRNYQVEAADVFHAAGASRGGSGVIVLPCGAGKTIVGISVIGLVQTHTLILTPNITAARQWIRELLDKTELTEEQVGEYSGEHKQIRPITVATYQILTRRGVEKDENGDKIEDAEPIFSHFHLFDEHPWGLVIYDEVHLLPAPVFRVCAEMQATRRLGLTATLVREDGRETEVFSLIGPKKYDLPWKLLEAQGWIAKAVCREIRLPLTDDDRMRYALAEPRDKVNIAACNKMKELMVETLMDRHQEPGDRILIIGQYLDQLDRLAERLKLPLITGKTPNAQREMLYEQFRTGQLQRLMVSKVGNFALDLPDASVLIQISGTFGSRQEEAQRLGRILRPKADNRQATFYSLVTRDTREQEFAMNRQLFLAEQGYQYEIIAAEAVDAML